MNTNTNLRLLAGAAVAILLGAMITPAVMAQIVPPPLSDAAETVDTRLPGPPPALTQGSLSGGFLEEFRGRLGFSIGVFHFYTPDGLVSSTGRQPVEFTSIRPRLSARIVQRRNTELSMSYSYGRRVYRRHGQLDNSDHWGSLSLQRRLSRNASLQVTDSFRSGFTDDASFAMARVPGALLVHEQAEFSGEILFDRQRVSTNTLSAGVSVDTGPRSNLRGYAVHDFRRYTLPVRRDAQGAQVGISGSYQINRWLSFASSYSTYLYTTDERFRGRNIQRLQAGGFRFNTPGNFELFFSGGADHSRGATGNRTAASGYAGISKISESSSFSLTYHNGLTNVFGRDAVLRGHNVRVSLDQRLGRRLNYGIGAQHSRGTSLMDTAGLKTTSAYTGLSIVLQNHLLFSVNGSYVSQRPGGSFDDLRKIDRYSVSAGFQYSLPSLLGR